jgi:hypothetical protein
MRISIFLSHFPIIGLISKKAGRKLLEESLVVSHET